MNFIHELHGWPKLTWDREVLSCLLADVRHKQGRLLGRMGALGFDLKNSPVNGTSTSVARRMSGS